MNRSRLPRAGSCHRPTPWDPVQGRAVGNPGPRKGCLQLSWPGSQAKLPCPGLAQGENEAGRDPGSRRQAESIALWGAGRFWHLLGPKMLRGTSLACQSDGFCRHLPCRLKQSWPCASTWAKAVPPDPWTERVGPSGSGELLTVAARERCYDSKGFMMQARGRRAVLSSHHMSQLGRGSCQ